MTISEWKSLSNEAGEREGLGDAGIETFRDAPYSAHAREGGQNTADAADTKPVLLKFDRLLIPREDFPSIDALQNTLASCRGGVDQEREVEFFDNALKVISQPQIPVLRMSDTNTTGLIGPSDEEGTAFHSLVKASGVTAKEKADSGGSFGIGKNSAYAISDLQTVFYSTLYKDPASGNQIFAAQGKAKLVSHETASGEKCRATSYWGNPDGYSAVSDQGQVPEWMRRDEIGTSVFSTGFRTAADWAERMSYSLVANFFAAIHRGQMVFEVDDSRYTINAGTVEAMLDCEELISAAANVGGKADIEFARQLHRCITSDAAEEITLDIGGLGKMRVRILTEEGMPKRVGFIRNGMLITDNLQHFGDKFARFSGSKDFIAVVEPVDKVESSFLKRLENPAHDSFSSERINDEMKRNSASRCMKQLAKELRQLIKDTTGVKREGSVQIEELGHFFAEKAQQDEDPNEKDEKNPERWRYKAVKTKRRRKTERNTGQGQQGGAGGSGSGGSGGSGSGSGEGSGVGGKGTRGGVRSVELASVRNKMPLAVGGNKSQRQLFFTSPEGGKAEITVLATGINSSTPLVVMRTTVGTTKRGTLIMDVTKDFRHSVIIDFDEPYEGPLELRAQVDTAVDGGVSSETV